MLLQINWTLIILIIAGSACLAYLGDVLGLKYGKQRISLFGLRPKYTSRIITAFMGIFISVAVLSVMAIFSENVRTALLTREALLADAERLLNEKEMLLGEKEGLLTEADWDLEEARLDLETARRERGTLLNEKGALETLIQSLREEFEEVTRDLDEIRRGTIAVQANSLLAQTFVPPGTPQTRVLEILSALRDQARAAIVDRRSERFSTDIALREVRLTFDPAEEAGAAARLTNSSERYYVRILAAENIAADEEVRGRLESGPSFLVYEEGAVLHRKLIDPKEQNFDAERTLHIFLRELKLQAIRYGILPDPATNSVGSLEGEEFFDVVERLKSITGLTILNAFALRDIYTEGPVRITIVLE